MVRAATEDDLSSIARLIRDLAEYEKLTDRLDCDETRLREHLFGPRPYAEVIVAEDATAGIVGFALFFVNYSTFLTRPGLYLEDLFVRPEYRGQGFGKALFLEVARIAVARRCGRYEWSVLDWNTPAIEFYKGMGAEPLDDWTVYRLDSAAMRALVEKRP